MPPSSSIRSVDSIKDQLKGQSILVRIDAVDETNLEDALPTLAFLSQSGARIVVATHSPVADLPIILTSLLSRPVSRIDEWKGEAGRRAVASMQDGEIAMMKD